jgi:serine/threonine-protein kinase HipA
VIEKRSGKPQLDEMGYLLHSPDDRAGPLGFGLNAEPPAPKRRYEGFRLPIEEATGP